MTIKLLYIFDNKVTTHKVQIKIHIYIRQGKQRTYTFPKSLIQAKKETAKPTKEFSGGKGILFLSLSLSLLASVHRTTSGHIAPISLQKHWLSHLSVRTLWKFKLYRQFSGMDKWWCLETAWNYCTHFQYCQHALILLSIYGIASRQLLFSLHKFFCWPLD